MTVLTARSPCGLEFDSFGTPDTNRSLFSFAYPAVEILCQEIRRHLPEVKIVLGGPHPSACYKEILESVPEVDFVVLGEGEESLLGLLEHLEGSEEKNVLSGVAARDESGEVVVLKSSKRIKNFFILEK